MASTLSPRRHRVFEYLLSYGEYPDEPPNERGRRRIMVGALWWSLLGVTIAVIKMPGPWTRIVALAQLGFHAIALWLIRVYPHRFRLIVHGVFAVDVVSEMTGTVLLGGLYLSGLNVLWALIVVLGALVAFTVRDAVVWFAIFIVSVIASASASRFVDPVERLVSPEIDGAFALIGSAAFVFAVMAYFVRQRDRFQRQSDDLLHNILPDAIADRLKEDTGMIAQHHDSVSVLFADVVGFTPMSAAMTATELVGLLNEIFTDIDRFVDEMGLEKIKTVGDEYMVAAGVPLARPDHAAAIADLALRIRDHVANKEFGGHRISFRIGINSGPVVAGIIGEGKFAYDLWGDTVNLASRMQSLGEPQAIQITAATYELVKEDFSCDPRGLLEVKGKGLIETWFLVGRN